MPGVRVAEDLVDRAFAAAAPNRVWVADITYLRTWEGWLYLVAVQDLYSRRIVRWSMADHMRTELVTDALQMALAARQPAQGLIWHSDQGSASRWPSASKPAPPASRNRWHHAETVSTTRSLRASSRRSRRSLIHRRPWPTRAELRTEVFDYIETFYNRRRRHSTLGHISPADFENMPLTAAHAA